MEYDGPFKGIINKAEKEYSVVRREESDNYLLNETLLGILNKPHSVKTLDEGIAIAERYAKDLINTIEAIKTQRGAEAFVDKPGIAADIFWKYQTKVLDKLKANTDLQGEALEVVVSGLENKYTKPTDVKDVEQVRSRFMAFLKAAEQFYKEPEKVEEKPVEETLEPVEEIKTEEPKPKKDITLLVGRYKNQMYVIEELSKKGSLHIKALSIAYQKEKFEVKTDIDDLEKAGLVERISEDKAIYRLTPDGFRLLVFENTDLDTMSFLENISRFEEGQYSTTAFNFGRFDSQYKIPSKSTLKTLEELSIITSKDLGQEVRLIIPEDKRKLLS